MKKILVGLCVITLLASVSYVWNRSSYLASLCYVHIDEDGKVKDQKTDSGKPIKVYNYKMDAYNSKGEKKNLTFTANHNLKHGVYLKIATDEYSNVIEWEEVAKREIPQEALDHLQ